MPGTIKALLLEDIEQDAELLKELLTSEGYSVDMDVVETKSEYCEKIKRQNYDIIYADYTLPSFNGREALELAMSICPSIPFVFISGTIGEDVAVEMVKQGATDYVLKDRIHRVGMVTRRALDASQQLKQFRQSQIEMQTNRRLLQNIINNARDEIYVKDLKGRYLLFNKASEQFAGVPEKEVIGRDDTFIFPEPEAKQFMESDRKVFESGEPIEMEGIVTQKDGTQRIIHTIKCPMFDDNGQMTGLFGISRDVTERTLMEQSLLEAKNKAEESDRLKTAFLQNISHEIRTPLNAIVGFTGLLDDPTLTLDKSKRYIDIIAQSSDQLTSIISDIISISTIESGLEKLSLYEVDLDEMIQNLYEQYILHAQDQQLEFTVDKPKELLSNRILTDGIKLYQILQNIIGNAFKYTEKGYVRFGYYVNDSKLEFYVEDSGVGIPAQAQKDIFKRFYRVESDHTIKRKGTGLGLSIAKAYVEILGGTLDVTSTVGKGSRFLVSIPYIVSKGLLPTDIVMDQGLEISFEQQKSILIVEDEDDNFNLIREYLTNDGLSLQRAINGREAVEMCQSDPDIDLVLMDLKLPIMNGFDATRCIRGFRSNLPIIAQTAFSTHADRTKALSYGCTDFISKPYRRQQLLEMVVKYLT